jgi:hypothetical protein
MDPFDVARTELFPFGAALPDMRPGATPAISNAQAFLQTPDHQAAVRKLVEELVAALTLAREQAEEAEQRARSARAAASRYKTESKASETVWRRRKAHWDSERQKHRRLCEKYEGLLNKVKSEAARRRSKPTASGSEPRTHGTSESKNLVSAPPRSSALLQPAPPTPRSGALAQPAPATTPTPVHGGGKTGRVNPPKPVHHSLPDTMESSVELELPQVQPFAGSHAPPLPQAADMRPSDARTDAPHGTATALKKREASQGAPKKPSKTIRKKGGPIAPLLLAGGDRTAAPAPAAVTPRPKPPPMGPASSHPAVYHQVVRGHARARLPARPCKECNAFFQAVGMDAGFCSDSCRHRYQHPRQETPAGFWSFDESGM